MALFEKLQVQYICLQSVAYARGLGASPQARDKTGLKMLLFKQKKSKIFQRPKLGGVPAISTAITSRGLWAMKLILPS